jgi:hypothetical protein
MPDADWLITAIPPPRHRFTTVPSMPGAGQGQALTPCYSLFSLSQDSTMVGVNPDQAAARAKPDF